MAVQVQEVQMPGDSTDGFDATQLSGIEAEGVLDTESKVDGRSFLQRLTAQNQQPR